MNFSEWRNDARDLLLRGEHPRDACWGRNENFELALPSTSFTTSFTTSHTTSTSIDHSELKRNLLKVPAEFIECAKYVYAFRADDTKSLLYRILWRLIHEDPNLLRISIDDDTREFQTRYRLVRRDIHKMKAFVRFKEVDQHYIAWHRPDHLILHLVAPFFVERFNGMNWSILTSDESAHWDQNKLQFTDGVPRNAAPEFDEIEELWKTYYKSIFNPARIKWKAMLKEMPARHWRTMPETAAIQDLIREAPDRLQQFFKSQEQNADLWIPKGNHFSLTDLKMAIPKCRACGICEKATQAVMGVGPLNAEIAIVGEQPGNEEDLSGTPFVGPSGKLLNEALELAGINRSEVFLTNAVKGFKFQQKENHFRLHRGSSPTEIAACAPWLKKELSIAKPKKIICLGRSAAQSLIGKSVLMKSVRGQVFDTPFSSETWVLPHPSSILRIQDPAEKVTEFNRWVNELKSVKTHQK